MMIFPFGVLNEVLLHAEGETGLSKIKFPDPAPFSSLPVARIGGTSSG
jgi:hypothetical protein